MSTEPAAHQRPPPDYSHVLSLLPEDVLLHVLASGTQRQLFSSVTLCCKAWRDAVLKATQSLHLVLKSDAAAASAALWIQRHGAALHELEITTAGLYSRHCSAATQLQLFQALQVAAGGAAAAAAAEGGLSDSEDEAGEQQDSPAAAAEPGAQPKALQLLRLVANLRLAPADCEALASLPAPGLKHLELHGSRTRRLTLDGVNSLARLTQLTSLCVQQLRIGDDAAALLAQHLTRLAVLELPGNNIGAAGAAAVAKHLTGLQRLDLSVNRIKDAGLSALCSTLQGLRALSISGNVSFSSSALQQMGRLTCLTSLHTSNNGLANAGLAAVASALPQLVVLDVAGNKISKADALQGMHSLTRLTLSRNPLQISSTKVFAGLPLVDLVLFDAAPAKAVAALAGLAATLTSLTLGSDPSVPGTKTLQLEKTRTCNTLFAGLAEACKLRQLAAPCTGLGDPQAKAMGRLGCCLTSLNISYNNVSSAGLRSLRELLPLLQHLELRGMRPELGDEAAQELRYCRRLRLLDLAFNDLTSEGVRQLGSRPLALLHLNLRSNVQVEQDAILHIAPNLSCLTYLNLLEVSGVSSASEVQAALPSLEELVLGGQYEGSHASRSGRVMVSCGG